MKTIFLGLCFFFIVQLGHAQGILIQPSMQPPDSIVGNFMGSISLICFVTGDGKIIDWQIKNIISSEMRPALQYMERLKWYYKNDHTGTYEPKISQELEFKNTSSGIRMAKKLSPWLKEYVSHTRFQILDSSAMQQGSWDGNIRQQAQPFGLKIRIIGKKRNNY